jgi:hypothetical protein
MQATRGGFILRRLLIPVAVLMPVMGSAATAAFALPIHQHRQITVHHERVVGGIDPGPPLIHRWTTHRTIVRVEHVAPPYVPPAPTPAASVTEGVAVSAPTSVSEAPVTDGSYSIPSDIVMCESGGDWTAVNPSSGAGGAYQILPSTWAAYGGTGAPQDASPDEQSAIAAEIYADSGGAAWVC